MSLAGSRLSSRWLVAPLILGIAAVLTLLAATGFLGIRYWREEQTASLAVEHSYRVIEMLARVRSSLGELESERRNRLLTPDTAPKPYGVSEESVRREVEALQALVADDPLQSLRAAHLALVVDAKLRQIDEIIATARSSGIDAALAMLQSKDEIESQIEQMNDAERFLIAEEEPRINALQQNIDWLIAIAVAIAVLFAAAAFALAWFEMRRRGKAEARIQRLVESNIIGILISDVEGRILEANDAFLDMMRYSRDDLVSGRMQLKEMTPVEWSGASEEAVVEMRTTGTCRPFEKEYVRKDGSRLPVLVGAAAFEEGQNASVAFVLDLTERKQAEKRQQRAEEELHKALSELAHVTRVTTLGEMTASIAHEVNQPLTGVVTAAAAGLRWLDRETPDLDEVRRALNTISKDGNRAGEVIRNIRGLLKKTETERTTLSPNEVVNEVVTLVQRELVSHGVSLRMELSPNLPVVLADRVQLQQVIINLVINGIEAMQSVTDRPRELVIRSDVDEKLQASVSVEDCGSGISAEDTDRMFTAFFTTKSSGMGIGLSVCRSIIQSHGGQMSATNNAGPGATVQFTLPAAG